MRIIAGDYKGRNLQGPSGSAGTRPTADRVREALFSHVEARLGNLQGLRVVDLFAGTGALGLEALSRGAVHAVFVETDHTVAGILRNNIEHCGAEERTTLRVGNAFVLSARLAPLGPFDLVLLDPPYRTPAEEVMRLLEALRQEGAIASGTYVVYEHERRTPPLWPACYDEVHQARYGKTYLSSAVVIR
ncbi:MAG: 16S rRNA (guanine(966)-N(2))-methyltransferase RsmD [Coriobacteriia bacterium]|nr:16S rRNA (guanine(966)-N(2))-methyltransferase RsmD [Coriobacteriia bacterium]